MSATKELFLRLTEEEYLAIPKELSEVYLKSKVYRQTDNDFDLLMQDENYQRLYKANKKARQELDDHTYYLREKRRNAKE